MRSIEFFILASLMVISFNVFVYSDTPTLMDVNFTGPRIIKDIPDQNLYVGQNFSNLLDLDDYFISDNGLSLIFTHSPVNNFTIIVDSENRLSIIPDSGFMGSESMSFTASDGHGSITGNTFLITIGGDIEAPKWSSQQIDRTSIYQNSFVTFTTQWSDNVNLGSYVLSINDGGVWRNLTLTSFTGTSNVSKEVLQISASPGTIVYWMFYASDWNGNTNVTDVKNFTIQEFEVTQQDFNNFYQSTGSGSSAASSQAQQQEGITTEAFTINVKELKITLRQGDSTTRVIKITNLLNTPLEFNAEIRGIGSMSIISENKFTIPPKGTYDLTIDFLIPKRQMPDEYYGSIVLGASERVVIPIILDVKPFESALSLTVNVSDKFKFVNQGDKVTARITLKSILDSREGTATLFYALKDFEGNILDSANETIPFTSFFSEDKSLIVPQGALDGEYIFYAVAFFDERVDLDSDTFFVGLKLQLMYYLKKLLYLIILLILIITIFYLYLLYKKNKRKKKLLELYLLLNELRDLVKNGKTKDAIEIYRRIKVAYGQHIPKDFIQNEEKLKVELDSFAKVLKETPLESIITLEEKKAAEAKKVEEEKKVAETKIVAETKKVEEIKPSLVKEELIKTVVPEISKEETSKEKEVKT